MEDVIENDEEQGGHDVEVDTAIELKKEEEEEEDWKDFLKWTEEENGNVAKKEEHSQIDFKTDILGEYFACSSKLGPNSNIKNVS